MGLLERFFPWSDHQPFSEKHVGFAVYFGDIQRMYIRYLHTKLIDLTVKVQLDCPLGPGAQGSLSGAEELGPLLRTYVQAVQDHDYMTKFAVKTTDPFIATSRRHHDHAAFETACARRGLAIKQLVPPISEERNGELESQQPQDRWIDRVQKASIPTGPWEDSKSKNHHRPASSLVNTRTLSTKRAFWTRVGAAAIGAAFLIAPMWILALQRNLYVHLGVATGCITAFGLLVSLYLETVDNVFAATLAYAAVIMVFVGIVLQEVGSQ
ncbi:hypothetical protein B0T20DRAFT_450520 [Sordaria brevicollis]|uniref:DUF6594 domain-containing protein n=1 Tax=Sordaria brevicollis TaxID=83679 RepID=A0AAE0UEN5_SORBR|nr:hypothetical protein B0T20DRAFT_450520 [Sordaria brevicollis]